MTGAKLSKLELQIMETLWTRGEASIREMQEAFPAGKRPGYTMVQTMIYRLEAKKVVRRVRKVCPARSQEEWTKESVDSELYSRV